MTLPLATTTISVLAPVDGDDTVAPGSGAAIHTRVPAAFSSPSGNDIAGSRVDARLLTSPLADLTQRHVVVDETTFQRWSVEWVDQRQGLGLDHTIVGVNRIRGAG
jgi:hypothetical protein